MQQAPGGTPGAYCPFCGEPVGVAGARFCAVCGRDMLTGAPNAGQPPQPGMMAAMMSRATVSAGRMIGVSLALMACVIFWIHIAPPVVIYDVMSVLGLRYFSGYFDVIEISSVYCYIVAAAATSYLIGLRRLASVSWWRTLAEALGFLLVLAVAVEGVFFLLARAAFGYTEFVIFTYPPFRELLSSFMVGAVIGVAFAIWSAPWSQVRLRIGIALAGYMRYLVIVFVIVALLFAIFTYALATAKAIYFLIFVFPAIFALMVIIGAALMAGRLNRLLAQSAAPSWSPSPTPPGAIPAWAPPVAPTPIPPSTPPVTPSGGIDPDR